MTPQVLISFKFLYNQLITFWAIPIPRENTPDRVKMSEFVLEKGPTLGSKIWQFFGSLVYPKCSKLEVYNPRVMILEIFSIIYKSNDPQIFHLQNKLWLHKLFMRLGACYGTRLFSACTHTVHMALVGYFIVFSFVTKPGQTLEFLLWGTIVPLNFLVGYHCSIVASTRQPMAYASTLYGCTTLNSPKACAKPHE